MPHKFSISKSVKRQEIRDHLNDEILSFIKMLDVETNAENLWLILRTNGYKVSQSSFNTRLKELVEAGFIAKRSVGYNKYLYLVIENVNT